MKKFRNTVVLIMTVCLVFGLAACGKNENSEKMDADAQQISQENESSEEERQTEKKDTLVVYFSATGNAIPITAFHFHTHAPKCKEESMLLSFFLSVS